MYELGFQDMVEVLGRSMSLQEVGQWGALTALVAGLLGLAASLQAAQAKVRLKHFHHWSPCARMSSSRLGWYNGG